MFLDAASQLIDAALDNPADDLPPRLSSIKFPAALEWMRIEDVVRLARSSHPDATSKKALTNRWPTRDEFIRDAIVHCMCYRDNPDINHEQAPDGLPFVPAAASFSAAVGQLTDDFLDNLLSHPRSYLLAHIGPMLPRYPGIHAEILAAGHESQNAWADGFHQLLATMGLAFRPEWPGSRVVMALQCMLDGFVVRTRVDPEALAAGRWESASLFADTVLAFSAGIIDFERSGVTVRDWLDQAVTASSSGAGGA